MEIKVTTLKQLLADVPQEVIAEALKKAADEALNQAMSQNWERQRFWYWMPRFEMRPSVMTDEPEGDDQWK